MWSTVLLFGFAVNFEPNRLALIALMLTKKRPIPQLIVFLGTAFLISSTVGLLVLFVFHKGLFGVVNLDIPKVQLGMGLVILALATVLALKSSWLPDSRRTEQVSDNDSTVSFRARRVDRLATRVRDVAQSDSVWFSGAVGAGMAMPTVEYMALLTVIVGSQTSPLTQVAALFTLLILGNLAGLVPIIGYLIAPERTREKIQKLNTWIRSRRRRDVIVLLTILGTALVVTGATGL